MNDGGGEGVIPIYFVRFEIKDPLYSLLFSLRVLGNTYIIIQCLNSCVFSICNIHTIKILKRIYHCTYLLINCQILGQIIETLNF